jgi:hypothetical protein
MCRVDLQDGPGPRLLSHNPTPRLECGRDEIRAMDCRHPVVLEVLPQAACADAQKGRKDARADEVTRFTQFMQTHMHRQIGVLVHKPEGAADLGPEIVRDVLPIRPQNVDAGVWVRGRRYVI